MGTTKRCLISRAEIARRVGELGERLGRDYGPDLVMVGVLKGVFIFMADLFYSNMTAYSGNIYLVKPIMCTSIHCVYP